MLEDELSQIHRNLLINGLKSPVRENWFYLKKKIRKPLNNFSLSMGVKCFEF